MLSEMYSGCKSGACLFRVCLLKYRRLQILSRNASYVQGQWVSADVREYFYFIDHQGQLFLDNTKSKNFITCFKDQQFLSFFFSRLKANNYGRYDEDFPFVSLCGKERNFLKCDDVPIVFTKFFCNRKVVECLKNEIHRDSDVYMVPNGVLKTSLMEKFDPAKLHMAETGRLYHPCLAKWGGVGLIKSSIAEELSSNFIYNGNSATDPVGFTWQGKPFVLEKKLR
ncbi:UPF0598 protein C8orf82 homolog [Convolutriloba macropyga]|uniref:UPF0598 protein C8orf82 homolog n=1 Tax=Convolutriloba macropyga TaxID=536237 RepID=UPI003F523A15